MERINGEEVEEENKETMEYSEIPQEWKLDVSEKGQEMAIHSILKETLLLVIASFILCCVMFVAIYFKLD